MEISAKPVFVPKKLPQIIAAAAASVGGLALGATMAWPSPCIPDIIKRGDMSFTKDEISWIVAIVPLGALAAGPVAGYAIEHFGRRRTIMLLTLPFVLSNLLVAFSTGVAMILAGRFLTGFCAGLATLACPVYITEIATDSIRGTLGSAFNAMLTVGTVLTFILGAATTWVWITILHAAIPIILLVGMFFVPESPIYSIMKGNVDEARKSLIWLRGAESEKDVEAELQMVQGRIEAWMNMQKTVSYRDLLKFGVWQPTLIVFALVFYNQMSAVNAMLAFSTTIVESTGSDLNPNVVSAILGCVVIISTFFMDKAGRITLLLVSEAGMSLAFVVLGIFYYMLEQKQKVGDTLEGAITWMPLGALFLYNLCYNLGLGPLPRIIATEILPLRVKGLTLAMSLSINWSLAFVVTYTFNMLRDALNPSGYFWLYAGICASGLIFIFFFVPETKGKSLADIEKSFQKKAPPAAETNNNAV